MADVSKDAQDEVVLKRSLSGGSLETPSPIQVQNGHDPEVLSDHAATPYSCFSKRQKKMIVFIISFTAIFSPISSFIFFPAIHALSNGLGVSIERINLTVTSYMVVSGIAPAVLGDMADMTGRRVVYFLTMGIYCIANVGLAVQSSWTALLLLRMLQSAGGAATIALGYGVVSDIAAPSERGGFVGALLLGPNSATVIGPILGGALVQHPGWRWIFWVLTMASGICLVLIAAFLPETSRFIVGNGSVEATGFYRTLTSHFRTSRFSNKPGKEKAQVRTESPAPPRRLRIPNPLVSLKILGSRDTALITSIYGIYYMNFSCLQASLSLLLIKLYGISELKAGIAYLPFGIGSCIGAYCSGPIMDRDYRVVARGHNIVIDEVRGDDIGGFPIEKARFRSIWYFIGATGCCTVGYGWALHFRTHLAVPLIMQFITGLAIAVTFNMCGTLLTDLHPKSPAAAQAANNIVRASLAGIGLAVLQILLDHMGVGWTFTLLGAISAACLGVAWLEWTYGQRWRKNMKEKGIER